MFDLITEGKYWDKPWSLVSGCTRCSPGCAHCWALEMQRRFHFQDYHNCSINIHPERLDIPMRRKKRTVWALWNDIAHESINMRGDFIRSVFRTMGVCQDHIFLLLTKRPKRLQIAIDNLYGSEMAELLPHVWPGTTVCNQSEADEKIPVLLQVPAAVRFLSLEPMLGPIDLKYSAFNGADSFGSFEGINLVILGGESGPGARPMHPDWVRSVRDQCQTAEVPFFFKNWGEWSPGVGKKTGFVSGLNDGQFDKAGDKNTYEWGAGYISQRVGKKAAGRLLDGRQWNELPRIK